MAEGRVYHDNAVLGAIDCSLKHLEKMGRHDLADSLRFSKEFLQFRDEVEFNAFTEAVCEEIQKLD